MSLPQTPADTPAGAAAVPTLPALPWRRLDRRMLLVHPVQELVRFLPAVVGAFVVGSTGRGDGQWWWQLVSVAVPVLLGVVRFFTTRFRITTSQVELSRGLLSRKVLTARLDRVRAVELTSSPIHRVLGLAKVEIGTASASAHDEEKFALDALSLAEARTLRAALLHREAAATDESPVAATGEVVLVRWDPAWVRYAPLTSSGNVVAAAVIAGLGQFADRLGVGSIRDGDVQRIAHLGLLVIVLVVVVGFLVLGAVFAVLGYLVTNWGFTLSRDAAGRSFHVRRGLLTSSEVSLERERVRGLELHEPLGLRLAGAARLTAIVTGLSRSERQSTQLVPPAPRGVVDTVGGSVLETSEPLTTPLRQHGPAARRRRWTRALVGAAVLPAGVLALAVAGLAPAWLVVPALLVLPLGGALAVDRYRRLGHALTPEHLVIRWGSLRGRRDVLQRAGIIGWNLHQSWWQRRAGLVTLVATTAAGQQGYDVVDVPEEVAIALADAAVPGLVSQFR